MPSLDNIPYFHYLIGLINLSLKDWDQCIKDFKKALILDKNFTEAHFNMGIAYYDIGELEKSFQEFLEVINLKKNHERYRDSLNHIIQVLTFFKSPSSKDDIFSIMNNKLQELSYDIDFSTRIPDEKILNFYDRCKSIVSKYISDFSFINDQLHRRNKIDLNCERHKKVFNQFNTIPKFCFGCFKVVIELESVLDLIKLSFIFDELKILDKFDRKCMIDKKSKLYKGYIYCPSIKEVKNTAKLINPILEKALGKKIKLATKRGCSEFAISYPDYKEIKTDHKKMMPYPEAWSKNEQIIDQQNFKDNLEKGRNKQKSLSGTTLSDFLIIHNWLIYANSINDISSQKILDEPNRKINKTPRNQSRIKKNSRMNFDQIVPIIYLVGALILVLPIWVINVLIVNTISYFLFK